jgi:hypothetical protein
MSTKKTRGKEESLSKMYFFFGKVLEQKRTSDSPEEVSLAKF